MSKRIKRFFAEMKVSREAIHRANIDLRALAEERLSEQLSKDLTGPRGGRYEPIGDIAYLGSAEVGDDFMRNTLTIRAERMGRYVRPKH